MSVPTKLLAGEPHEFHDNEIRDFMALVIVGGEVTRSGLEDRIRSAPRLVFLYLGHKLTGIAALKRPDAGYRYNVSSKSGVPVALSAFPYELGYMFVVPSARGRGLSLDLARSALSGAGNGGVFATSRIDNK